MSSLITTTSNTTYTMLVNTQPSSGFEVSNTTESNGTLGNVTITQANQEGETNYQINGTGNVINASFDLNFTLSSALAAGSVLGFSLNPTTTPTGTFTFSTGALTVDTTTFFAATTDNTFGTSTAVWQATGTTLAEATNYTIPVTIIYTGSTAGDNIVFQADFFVYNGTTVTADSMASDTVTVTVYSSVITPSVITQGISDSNIVAQTAFTLGSTVIFQTTLTPTTTNQYYRNASAISFAQTIPDLMTITGVYASVDNVTTVTGGVPTGLTALTGASAGLDVSYDFTAANYNNGTDTSVIPVLYVWVFCTAAAAPGTLPAAPA